MKFKLDWKQGLKVVISSALLLLATFVKVDLTSSFNQVAQAATISQTQIVLLDIPSPSDIFDEITGSSAAKRVEGTTDRVVGRAKRDIGELSGVSNKVEGLAQEAKGKAKQDIAKVQTGVEKVADDAAELYDEMAESVREKL